VKYLQDDGLTYSVNYINRVPLIRLSEMYYIAAESASDTKEKVRMLNSVRANRGLKALAETLTETEIATEIFKEYKKEFYQEGQLFFYYKRLNKSQIDGYASPATATIYVLPKPNDENEFNP
jgi:hypothetical protein